MRVVTKVVTDPRWERYRYTEGYAYDPKLDLLLEHAWIESPEGVVHDPTWPENTGCAYLGLTFTHEQVLTGYLEAPESLLFGDWARGFPLLLNHTGCCAPLPPARHR
ncbi:hypothetical protein [Nocardioides sp. MH1]|uniref:hypothetical protein n=1 Tax=Nocardioides sp. MH1 TaxID=3242490 RepID=UPI0035214A61